MGVIAEALGGQKVFVEFPATGVREWIAAAEVLVQEGLTAWALPVGMLGDLPDAVAIFGHRARVGVWGVLTPADAARAAAGGAHFITSPIASADLVAAAGGTPCLLGALTPGEVAAALDSGATAVQVVPADVMAMHYSRTLPALFPGVELVATGRFERFQCEMWLQAGAAAIGLSGMVVKPEGGGPGAAENDLDAVRRATQTYRQLEATRGN